MKLKKNLKSKKILLIPLFFITIILCCLPLLYLHNKKDNILPNDKKNDEISDTEENNFKELIKFQDDKIIANLIIRKINLNAPVSDGTDFNTLNSYIGHFPNTAYFDGNIALAGHNAGFNNNYFKDLNKLEINDEIIYVTKYGESTYKVNEILEISETDINVLQSTEDNRLTLITCINSKPDKRLCIIAKKL